jgi:hypothetical protein
MNLSAYFKKRLAEIIESVASLDGRVKKLEKELRSLKKKVSSASK